MMGDRKGDIGFMEAVASAAAVCLVMTAFAAFCAAEMDAEEGTGERPSFDWPGDGLSPEMTASALRGCAETQMERGGWNGVRIDGPDGTCFELGRESGDVSVSREVLRVCPSEKEIVPAVYEAFIWF